MRPFESKREETSMQRALVGCWEHFGSCFTPMSFLGIFFLLFFADDLADLSNPLQAVRYVNDMNRCELQSHRELFQVLNDLLNNIQQPTSVCNCYYYTTLGMFFPTWSNLPNVS